MRRKGRNPRKGAAIFCLTFAVIGITGGSVADAAINIEFRPASQAVVVGDTVNVGLYVVSDSDEDQLLAAAQVILSWDPEFLQLLGNDNTGAVALLSSSFPSNDPFNLNEQVPPQDGDGLYVALAPLGDPVAATPKGTLLTTFQFQALAETPKTPVDILETGGDPQGETIVFDGKVPNLDVTGTLTGAVVQIVAEKTTTAPDGFNAFRGFFVSGTLDDLLESDDSDLCYNPGIVLSPTEAPVTLDFFGTLPNDSPSTLDVTIESTANTVGLGLTISFWNYNTTSWDVVGTDAQSLNADTVRTFPGNPADHVESGTGAVRTRYEVRVVSLIFVFPWLDCVDHVFWTTS